MKFSDVVALAGQGFVCASSSMAAALSHSFGLRLSCEQGFRTIMAAARSPSLSHQAAGVSGATKLGGGHLLLIVLLVVCDLILPRIRL